MIHGVIFDFGNVIASFDNRKFTKALAPYSKRSEEELYHAIYESDFPKLYETGQIDSDEFYSSITKLTHSNISKEKFLEIYTKDKFTPIPSTISLLKSLKKSFKIGLLSNTSELDYELGMKPILERENIYFNSESLSFKVHAIKPDKRIYKHALENLELRAEQCIYVDDIETFVNRAEKIGMRGIHYNHKRNNLAEKLDEICLNNLHIF